MTELAKLTWPEARELFGPDLVAILPIGATEPHGPHLTLDADVTIAQAQSRRAVELLADEGIRAILLPAVNYGLTHFTDGFEGRISLRPGTLWALLEDVIESLEDQGVRRIVFSNAHLEPEHVQILRGVAGDCTKLTEHKAQVLFPDNTRRRWAEKLGADFQRGDHAGRYETSIAMAADPAAVRDEERAKLPAVDVDLIGKIRSGAKSFVQAGATEAYCGNPAEASAEEGKQLIEALAGMIVASVKETWPELVR